MKKVTVLIALCFALCSMSFAGTGAVHKAQPKMATTHDAPQRNGKHRHKHRHHRHLHHKKRHQ